MKTITRIEAQRGKRARARVYLEGAFAFVLNLETVQERGLEVGQGLSEPEIQELLGADAYQSSLKAVLNLLGHRPRSEQELRQRLRRRFDEEMVEGAIQELKERQLLDDAAFARFWQENRITFSPRSQRMIRSELRQKGIASEIAQDAVEHLDDEESAYRAGQKKARLCPTTEYSTFRKKLGTFLVRRGFSYEVTEQTIRRLWQERVG